MLISTHLFSRSGDLRENNSYAFSEVSNGLVSQEGYKQLQAQQALVDTTRTLTNRITLLKHSAVAGRRNKDHPTQAAVPVSVALSNAS